MKFKIAKEVFEKFPNLVVYIPVIYGFNNSKSEKNIEISIKIEREQELFLRDKVATVDDLKENPYIKSYFECFKQFGEDPTKAMPTHFALAKRVLQGKDLPNINPVVNIYNSISIKYLTPFGGEDLKTVYGDFELKFANGTEHWLGIGEVNPKSPAKGDLVWGDLFDISTVSLNWRQCDRTKLTEYSTDGYFIMDGFRNINEENIKGAAKEFTQIITENFGGKSEMLVLDIDNPEAEISFESKSIDGVKLPTVTHQNINPKSVEEKRTTKIPKQVKIQVEKTYVYDEGSVESVIQKAIFEGLKSINDILKIETISVDRTADNSKGDFTSTFAMKNASKFGMKPMELGEKVVAELSKKSLPEIERIEAVFPGFVNFYLNKNSFKQVINSDAASFGKHEIGKGKTIMIEYGGPNTHKAMTLGHVKSGISGQCIVNLQETLGYKVIKANYYSDIGLHVPKCMVGLFQKYCDSLEFSEENIQNVLQTLEAIYKKDGVIIVAGILGKCYPEGHSLYKSDEGIKQSIDQVNKKIFDESDPLITNFYKVTRAYSVEYQDLFFSKLGIRFDREFPESEVFTHGAELVNKYLGKVFVKDAGAIIFPGEKYGLSRWVFVNKLGIATYSGKDLALAYLKFQEYPDLDFAIVFTSVEQISYFKAVIKALELIDEKFIGKYMHIGFGWLLYGGKKLSSKTWKGSQVDDTLDELTDFAQKLISSTKEYSQEMIEDISRKVGIASLKFAILSHEFHKDVNYDPAKFTTMSGFSAPYIMYSYARAYSILESNKFDGSTKFNGDWQKVLNEKEEVELCKLLVKFPEVTLAAGKNLTPHRICTYMFEVANAFSAFYLKCKVTTEKDNDIKMARLLLVNLTAEVLKKSMEIIGIDPVTKM